MGPGGRGFRLFAAMLVAGGFYMIVGTAGQRMVDTVQGFKTRQQMTAILTAVTVYRARFNALPGDDARATARWGLPPAEPAIALGNGTIDGPLFDLTRPETEAIRAWSHLRAAGRIDGDPGLIGIGALPAAPLGGRFAFAGRAFGMTNVLCVSGVPGTWAAESDNTLDDGYPDIGTLRAGRELAAATPETGPFPPTAPAEEAYDPDAQYTLCRAVAP